MDVKPSYRTILVRNDGQEFGLFNYGGRPVKFRSIFPGDLRQHELTHDTAVDALNHINKVWMQDSNTTDDTAFGFRIEAQKAFDYQDYVHCV
jgi:hypothetical protein